MKKKQEKHLEHNNTQNKSLTKPKIHGNQFKHSLLMVLPSVICPSSESQMGSISESSDSLSLHHIF